MGANDTLQLTRTFDGLLRIATRTQSALADDDMEELEHLTRQRERLLLRLHGEAPTEAGRTEIAAQAETIMAEDAENQAILRRKMTGILRELEEMERRRRLIRTYNPYGRRERTPRTDLIA